MRHHLLRTTAAMAITGFLGCLSVTQAQATTATFSYNNGTDPVIGGKLEGTLSGNRFTVTAVDALTLDGTAISWTPVAFGSMDGFMASGYDPSHTASTTGVVTVDGSFMDFAVTDYSASSAFGFAVGDATALLGFGMPTWYNSGVVGTFVASDWSFNPTAASPSPTPAPEPMSVALFGAGLSGLAAARKRRASRKAS